MRKSKTVLLLTLLLKYGLYSTGIILILITQSSVTARALYNNQDNKSTTNSYTRGEPYPTIRVHNVGRLGLTITNQGQIGTGFMGDVTDPLDPTALAPSCTYPYPGNKSYLYAGAIWIGAIVGKDTLVSVGADGWIGTKEIWPDPFPRGDIKYLSNLDPDDLQAVSEQDFVSIYTDTCTNIAYVAKDPRDGRPHIPLEVEITQKSHAWSETASEDFVIFEYIIKNIGKETIEKAYMGIYVDGDVGQVNADIGEAIDDICGFKKTIESPLSCGGIDTVNLAWIADNNGRNDAEECPYGADAVTSVTGVSLLKSPSDTLVSNFNWWISNGSSYFDFGPRKAGTEEDPFRDFGGYLGTPMGDRNKYYILSHPEIDYDQLFCAKDNMADGWLERGPDADNFADGYDTRYLLSFGPFNIQPGEELPLVFAYVAGENFHTDCDAYADFDRYAPEEYYSTFSFDDIGQNVLNALWKYDIPGVDTDGDGYAGKFRICNNDEDTIYYRGDGVSDLIPIDPHPPSLRTTPGETSISVKWNGLKPEYYDLNSPYIFEGYKIYLASGENVEESDYELMAAYDLENYHRYFGSGEPIEWTKIIEHPMTPKRVKSAFGIDNPEDYDINNPLQYSEGYYYYFEPAGENNYDLTDPSGIHKLYPASTYPSTENPRFCEPEELTDGGFLKYFDYEYIIQNLDPGVKYHIDIKSLSYLFNGSFYENSIIGSPDTVFTRQSTAIDEQEDVIVPIAFSLEQNRPNPFNPTTVISFTLPRASIISFEIYNILGQRVIELGNGFYEAGKHSLWWNGKTSNGKSVSSGVYFYKLSDGEHSVSKKMLLLK